MKKVGLVVVAGGASQRYSAECGRNKLLELLDDKPVFIHSLLTLSPCCKETVLVIPGGATGEMFRIELLKYRDELSDVKVVSGGLSRMESVRNGVKELSEDLDLIAIHDAARPLVSKELLFELIDAAGDVCGAVPGHVMTDSMKFIADDYKIDRTIKRERLYAVSTPQVFSAKAYRSVIRQVLPDSAITDDAEMMRIAGMNSVIVREKSPNVKLTVKQDLQLLKFYFNVIKNSNEKL